MIPTRHVWIVLAAALLAAAPATRAQREAAGRVVFSTGDTVHGDTTAFLESQAHPFLNKPFSLAELRALLARSVAAPA